MVRSCHQLMKLVKQSMFYRTLRGRKKLATRSECAEDRVALRVSDHSYSRIIATSKLDFIARFSRSKDECSVKYKVPLEIRIASQVAQFQSK